MRVLAMLLVVACADHQPTHIVPLAELAAEMQLGDDPRPGAPLGNALRLHPPGNGDYCEIVSPRNARAVLDGMTGELVPGGGSSQTHQVLDCTDSAFVWRNAPRQDGPSTFEITDGSTTWTFVVWQPFAGAGAAVTSHPAETPVLVGDTVVIEASGPLFDAKLVARDDRATTLFELDTSSGLTVVGAEVSFVMPAVTATMVRLDLRGEIEKRIDRCDASLGCQTRYELFAFPTITVAP